MVPYQHCFLTFNPQLPMYNKLVAAILAACIVDSSEAEEAHGVSRYRTHDNPVTSVVEDNDLLRNIQSYLSRSDLLAL